MCGLHCAETDSDERITVVLGRPQAADVTLGQQIPRTELARRTDNSRKPRLLDNPALGGFDEVDQHINVFAAVRLGFEAFERLRRVEL